MTNGKKRVIMNTVENSQLTFAPFMNILRKRQSVNAGCLLLYAKAGEML